jgi:hypothetical protein
LSVRGDRCQRGHVAPEHLDAADLGRLRAGRLRRRESDVLVSRPLTEKPLRRESDGWLERWMATVEDLARLKSAHPMLDAVIDEQTDAGSASATIGSPTSPRATTSASTWTKR